MFKIKRNDIVQVTKGKDAGKKGKVLKVFCAKNRALVEGINLVKKHRRQTRQDQQAGIVSIESPIAIANLLPFCSRCSGPNRVGFKALADGTKARVCRSCKEVI